MYLCKALLNVCIYDKGAIKIRYNNNNKRLLVLVRTCTHDLLLEQPKENYHNFFI